MNRSPWGTSIMRLRQLTTARRILCWILAGAFLYAQAAMSLTMGMTGMVGSGGAMQMSMMSGETYPGSPDALDGQTMGGMNCPMQMLEKSTSTTGCAGCSPCCSVVSDAYWHPESAFDGDVSIISTPTPITHVSFPPFHPPRLS